uniref:Uncharacterized protein n=1 Tax=Plectus sambesii TaxID=2011161 RepID=A0A914XE86_9BILA
MRQAVAKLMTQYRGVRNWTATHASVSDKRPLVAFAASRDRRPSPGDPPISFAFRSWLRFVVTSRPTILLVVFGPTLITSGEIAAEAKLLSTGNLFADKLCSGKCPL